MLLKIVVVFFLPLFAVALTFGNPTTSRDAKAIGQNSTDWKSWSLEELERQMDPKVWVLNKTAAQLSEEYYNVTKAATLASRKSIPHKLDIPYGTLPAEKFDLYGTDLPETARIFFFIHGGYWQAGSRDFAGGFALANHKRGLKTVVPGYTLAPDAKISQMQEEIIACLGVVQKMFPKTKIIVVGHSAGAQLAASVLHAQNLPQETADSLGGAILIAGVYDLRPLVPTSWNKALKLDEKEAEAVSPLLLSFNNELPIESMYTLVLVGGSESPEFQRQALAYAGKLCGRFPQSGFFKSVKDDHFTILQNLVDESSDFSQQVYDAWLEL